MRALAFGLSLTAWTLWGAALGTLLASLWNKRWDDLTAWLLLSAAIVFALSSAAAGAAGDWASANSLRRTGWVVIATLVVWTVGDAWQDRRDRRRQRPRDEDEKD